MGQGPVVTIEDASRVALESRRPGCGKGVLHVEGPVQSAIFRVAPGSGVPAHLHSRVHDLFFGVAGVVEIRYEGQHGHGTFQLKPGAFCAMPPGVRHEVFNPGPAEALFLSVHAPHEGYDFVPVDFRQVAAALPDCEYDASQRPVPRDASR